MTAIRRALTRAALVCALAGCACTTDGDPPRHEVPVERRIVALAPAAAEMLDALGASASVVGVGDYVTRPARLAALPRVGAYDRPNIELLLALEADLLVSAASRAASPVHERLEALGIEVLALDTATFDGVFESLERLGRALGRTSRARRLADRMRDELATVRRRAAGAERRRVLVVVGRDPLFVAGPGSHVDELLQLLGAENIAADAGAPWSRISLETVLERVPDVIVDAADNRDGARRGAIAGVWAEWPFLPAVRDARVYHLHPDLISIPGMRLPAMAGRLARLVHPERFGEPHPDDFVPSDDGGAP